MQAFLFVLIFHGSVALTDESPAAFAKHAHSPTDLMTDLLRYPELAVTTDSKPEFSWVVPNSISKQMSYRIIVASSMDSLSAADMWDSGVVESNRSSDIEYAGTPLKPLSSYWWKVSIADETGNVSQFSEAQQFRTSNFLNRANKEQWPGESLWIELDDGRWVSENRQTAVFKDIRAKQWSIKNENGNARHVLIDFERSAFSTLDLKLSASSNTDVMIHLGERLNENGLVHRNPGKSNISYHATELAIKPGTHEYRLTMPPNESGSPHHQQLAPFYPEVLPFRYAEVVLPSDAGDVSVDDITQVALYYPFDDEASSFQSSSEALNQIWALSKYTLKATPFLGLYSDGNRERMPYEADAYIQQLGHYSVDREYSVARYTFDFLMYHASWPTEWHLHMPMIAWQDYLYTGNDENLSKFYDALNLKTLSELAREDGLISTTTEMLSPDLVRKLHYNGTQIRDIVDWPKGTPEGEEHIHNQGPTPAGERDNYVFTDYNTVVNSFHYNSLVLMEKIATALGKQDNAKAYQAKAQKVKASILEKMFNADTGLFVDGIGTEHSSLHANMFALAFDLVPPEHDKSVIEHIKSKGMAASVYGAQHLLDGLYKAGQADYAMSLLESDGKRSWLNMIRAGSTMTTEAWDEYYKPNLTWNHAWGAAPANILPRRTMGIIPLDAGFSRFQIMPQPGPIKTLSIQKPTIKGTIVSQLQVLDGNSDDDNDNNKPVRWELDIVVPGNTQAELWLPAIFNSVLLNGKMLKPQKIEYRAGKNRHLFLLPSGEHGVIANKQLLNKLRLNQ